MISAKTHPVITFMLGAVFLVSYGLACAVGGWSVRVLAESRAELSVVVDDGKFLSALKSTLLLWGDQYNVWEEDFREANPDIPDCISMPMPKYYHDNDAGMLPFRE